MATAGIKDTVIAELESLKQRLDESLVGLAGKTEHVPMHEIVHGLIALVAEQHAEIQKLKAELAETRARRNTPQS